MIFTKYCILNAVTCFVTRCNCCIILNIIHRLVSYLKLNSIDISLPHREHITSQLRVQKINVIYSFVMMVRCINVTITIQDTIHRPSFYLKLNSTQLYGLVRMSQETHYVSATRPTG
jgi:hypothetical protein